MYRVDDTIAAISSPPGGAARGILRLSGPGVLRSLAACCPGLGAARLASLRRPQVIAAQFHAAGFGVPVPCAVYLWPEKRSYTGQMVAEIHTFGSPPVLETMLRTLCAHGARLAAPGEFTLRAFLSGRIDLVQAEAVLGVIDAADQQQFRAAVEQLAGGLGNRLWRLREELIELLAHLEAGFDFADEDIAFITPAELDEKLAAAAAAVSALSRQMAGRAEAVEAVRVVLVGRPNVGKSSLFNALVEAVSALVCAVPGTTRDYLTAELHLRGLSCLLVDTAGADIEFESRFESQAQRAAEEPFSLASGKPNGGAQPPPPQAIPVPEISAENALPGIVPSENANAENALPGIACPEIAAQWLAARQAQIADVRLLCLDATRRLDAWERAVLARPDAQRIVVLTKTDAPRRTDYSGPAVATSSVTGAGLDQLRECLAQLVCTRSGAPGDVVPATAVRCAESLRVAEESLQRARALAQQPAAEELVAAELRAALEALGQVVGAVCSEDVLDRIFQRFCIGK